MPTERSVPDACPGIVAVHQADDGGLVRIRLPGGLLTGAQLTTLAEASAEFGDGNLDLTSRANLQIRGLRAGTAEGLSQRLYAGGLLPSIRHDRVRNLVASPLTGLDERSLYDVLPLARELDRRLCGSDRLAELPGRFLFTLDDGRGDVSTLSADAGLQAVGPRSAALLLAGVDTGIRIDPGIGVDVLIAAAEAFLIERARDNPTAWRLAELPSAITRILPHLPTPPPAVQSSEPSSVSKSPADLATSGPPPVGVHNSAGGRSTIVATVPLGRMTQIQAEHITQLVGPDGEVRITPWRSVVLPIPDVPNRQARRDDHAHAAQVAHAGTPRRGTDDDGEGQDVRNATDRRGDGRDTPGAADGRGDGGNVRNGTDGHREGRNVREGTDDRRGGRNVRGGTDDRGDGREGWGVEGVVGWLVGGGLVVDPGSAWVGVTACTGRPGCGKALADVRADAVRVIALTGNQRTVHWSGCERRCGRPKGDLVDIVATSNGYQVDGQEMRGAEDVAALIEADRRTVADQAGEGDR